MHNCVGSYINRIRKMRCDIYRVLKPERITLEIKRLKKGPAIGECKARFNNSPGINAKAEIFNWFYVARTQYISQRKPEKTVKRDRRKNNDGQQFIPGI